MTFILGIFQNYQKLMRNISKAEIKELTLTAHTRITVESLGKKLKRTTLQSSDLMDTYPGSV